MFNKLTPNMMVEDVERTIAFYTQTLGFEVLATNPETQPFEWAMVGSGGVTLMFQSRPSFSQEFPPLAGAPVAASLSFYTEVTGIDALYERLRERVEIVKELHDSFYGTREFAFRDCNGYVLALSEQAGQSEQ
jgi:uncharacterized glyoxalase superfamily protein PhnB